LIAYLQIQRFYVRTLGLEDHPDPVVVTKNKTVLDLNLAAAKRRVDAEMSARDAKASLMGGIFREWDAKEFRQAQRDWLDFAVDFSDVVEPDEQHSAWVDLSKHPDPIATYRAMLEAIPHSNGGLSPTKWLSKLAAKRNDASLNAVFDAQVFLSDIPIHQIEPITFDQAARLEFLGYSTCGKALDIPLDVLQRQFGGHALTIWNALRGQVNQAVQAIYPEKSAADRTYFPAPVEDIVVVDNSLLKLANRLASRLQGNDLFGATMKLILEFEDRDPTIAERTFTKPLHDRRSLYFASKRLYDSLNNEQPVAAIRISLPELHHKVHHQESFDQLELRQKLQRADTVVKCVRKSYGDAAIKIAGDVQVPRRQLVLKEWRNATGWN
jgi:hypothetical protein